MFLLGIESSCDETSAAIVKLEQSVINGHPQTTPLLFSDVTARQEEVHVRYGGVVPELASRRHLESLLPVVQAALAKAGITYKDLGAIAVTNRPGLIGSLLIGLNAAKTLAYSLGIPLIPINHLEAHLAAVTLEGGPKEFPCLGLIISGGHTSLYEISEGWSNLKAIGHTRDDAAGEAFDKGARLLGLPYPGGPEISRLAEQGDPNKYDFPRALPAKDVWDFSFSGLKTALSTFLQDPAHARTPENLPHICASYQEAIVDALVAKSVLAVKAKQAKHFVVAGGVAANKRLRTKLLAALPKSCQLHIPSPQFCTDNGAMIAALGAIRFSQGEFVEGEDLLRMTASPRTEAKEMRGKQ